MVRLNCTKSNKKNIIVVAVFLMVTVVGWWAFTSSVRIFYSHFLHQKDEIVNIVTPVRVPRYFREYLGLLSRAEEGGAVSTADIVASMPRELLETCGSPILAGTENEFLDAVFSLGTNMVAHFFGETETLPTGTADEAERLDWLLQGLRQEPGLMHRLVAITIEKELVRQLLQHMADTSGSVFCLADECVRDYLSGTSALLLDILHTYRCEEKSADAKKLYSDVEIFLHRLALFPRDYSALSVERQAICDQLYDFGEIVWAPMIHTIFDGFLKVDIELHFEKRKLCILRRARRD